jgi:hypothetical protein
LHAVPRISEQRPKGNFAVQDTTHLSPGYRKFKDEVLSQILLRGVFTDRLVILKGVKGEPTANHPGKIALFPGSHSTGNLVGLAWLAHVAVHRFNGDRGYQRVRHPLSALLQPAGHVRPVLLVERSDGLKRRRLRR